MPKTNISGIPISEFCPQCWEEATAGCTIYPKGKCPIHKPMKTNIESIFENYWFYAGEWHYAGCGFVLAISGVCNCRDAKKEIRQKISELVREIIGEKMPEGFELHPGYGEQDPLFINSYNRAKSEIISAFKEAGVEI